jgi:hypothetical protein
MIKKAGFFLLIFLTTVVQSAEKDDISQSHSASKLLRSEGRDLISFTDMEAEEDDASIDLEAQVTQLGRQMDKVSRDVQQIEINIGQLDRREKASEEEIRNINKRLQTIEKNVAAVAGAEPVYHRIIRADMVLQLTCICTFMNVVYTLASGQGVGPALMAFIGAYSFYYFFKFIRDAGTVAGNVAFRRPN